MLTLQTVPRIEALNPSQRCANEQGFSLHVQVRCARNQRNPLERLCRYITCPAIADERLTINQNGDVVLRLKSPDKDATTHIVLSALEFMQRLAALVPRPGSISFDSTGCSQRMPGFALRSLRRVRK